MKPQDLFSMAWRSLKQRKLRTILTSLGVMIGCTSIVVMVSIGYGLTSSMDAMMEDMGSLTTLYVQGTGDGKPMDDKTVNDLKTLTGVEVIPKASMDNYMVGFTASNGRYVADWGTAAAMDPDKLEAAGYRSAKGNLALHHTGSAVPVLVGENFAFDFRDTMRPEGEGYKDRYTLNENGNYTLDESIQPWFDILSQPLTMRISDPNDMEGTSYYEVQVQPVGLLKEDYMAGGETSSGVLMAMDDYEKICQQAARKFGESAGKTYYSSIIVASSDISQVDALEGTLQQENYIYSGLKSMRESMQEQSRMVQLTLGGLGAISLMVAAIGIANTMVMAVSERTREIGIMKALGCQGRDIRILFLSEAGLIGLIGGIAGLLLSYIISAGINWFAWDHTGSFMSFLLSSSSRVSVIPVHLAVFGLVFAVLVGVVSGYVPAGKAVKVSALEAIRRE